MPFALDASPSQEELSSAVNYILANLQQTNSSNVSNGQITSPTGVITGYLYKYLAVKYADSFDGTLNFSNSPTGRGYYGIRNSNSSTESTNPADYVWNQVTGGFGTTKFLYYLTTGGRQIQIQIATAVPNPGWILDSGSAIDLDITAVTGSVANFVIIRVPNDSSVPTNSECISAIGRTPISGDLCTVNYNSGIYSIVYKYTTGWAIFQKYITGDLIVANSVVASNINSNNLTIKDGSGNILFGSGTNLAATYINPSTGWLNSNITLSSSGALNNAGGGSVTVAGLDNTIVRAANQITAANISTYIAGAAIGTAYIGNAAITNALIGTAAVNTLQIAGQAVTIPVSSTGGVYPGNNAYQIINSASVSFSTSGVVAVNFVANCTFLYNTITWYMYVDINGTTSSVIGGTYIAQSGIPLAFSLPVSAGTSNVKIYWFANDAAMRILSSELFVLGTKR